MGQKEVFKYFFESNSIKEYAKHISDNKFTLLLKASEILVDINHQNVLDVASCFADDLGGIPIGRCGGRKSNNKLTYWT